MEFKHHYQVSKKAILQTILYSDTFDYPLTTEELWHFLTSDKKITKKVFEDTLNNLTSLLTHKDGFYCFKGREKIISKRKKNITEVKNKLKIAEAAVNYLSYIPTIKLIGISGGLAMGDVSEEDDIDLFFIVEKATIWTTRLWILLVLEMIGLRRKKQEENPANKICSNMIIEETALKWPASKHDLYIAHEIAQLKPLFEREEMYIKFLTSNNWVEKYLPNALENLAERPVFKKHQEYYSIKAINKLTHFIQMERGVKILQKISIKRYQTTEIIQDNFIAFHPYDYRKKVLKKVNQKCKLMGY